MFGPQEPSKKCSRCKELKDESEFNYHGNTVDNLNSCCRECAYKMSRNTRLFRDFGITSQQYGKMLEKQNGVCKICGQSETHVCSNGKIQPLSVDHDHITLKIRGLLCHKCNTTLGSIGDNVKILKAMIIYLEENK